LLDDMRVPRIASTAFANLRWLSEYVPPRVLMSNVRVHLNGWHTKRRYQEKGVCIFCAREEDSLEHYFRCSSIRSVFPKRLKREPSQKVFMGYWFLFTLKKPDKILMALYIHAIYNMQNSRRHGCNVSELRLCIEMIVLDIPLRAEIQQYVRNAIRGIECKMPVSILLASPKRGPSEPSDCFSAEPGNVLSGWR
jgi:hypothetical protein